MKQVYYIGLLIVNILLLFSCVKEPSNMEEIEGSWFRSFGNKISGGHNQPSFERGESHVTITFGNNGEFVQNTTILGVYEGNTINDTSAIMIELGTYTTEDENIEIIINERFSWDSFFGDIVEFGENNMLQPRIYKDGTYEITNEEMKLEYVTEEDYVLEEQETPGFDKHEEVYIKL